MSERIQTLQVPRDASEWNERGAEFLPGHLGIEITSASAEDVRAKLQLSKRLHAPNGYLHAGTVVTLADTCCGYGTVVNLPEDAVGFTTIELKSNFLGTALDGDLTCVARPFHKGRTTQVWDAEVTSEASGKTIALFRCTQMVLRA
jgi:1,4-dihydroxy-2-naphthoyl-CoA hydrolase